MNELLIPLILIIHNAEEYFAFEEFTLIPEKFRRRNVFLNALIILTVFVSALCIANYFFNIQFLITLVVIALLLNGLQHCLASLWQRKMIPGTYSAIILLIPYALYYLTALGIGFTDFALMSVIALIFMIFSIYISLQISYNIN